MAQSFTTDAGVLYVPGAYPQVTVQQANSGLSATGIIMLVGEADAGPAHTAETDLTLNGYGPDQLGAVLAKYRSGALVDAYRAACAPSKDPEIQGAPSKIFLVKTNSSTRASASMARAGLTAYGTLADKSYGILGNNIYFSVSASTAESAPTTGSFTYIPSPVSSALSVRLNGGAVATATIAVPSGPPSPAELVGSITSGSATGLQALTTAGSGASTGLLVTGGVNRSILTGLVGTNVTVAAAGNSITLTLATGSWATTPSVGDTLCIPGANGDYEATGASAYAGGTAANPGAYVVTAATSSTITATKLRNSAAGGLTAPENVAATPIASATNDLICFSPVTIKNQTGTNRSWLTGLVGTNVTGTVASGQLTITLASGSWAATPQAGDVLFVPSSAPAAISNAVGGWWTVVSATSSTVVLTKLSNGSTTTFGATALAAVTDLQLIRPAIDGLSKTLELQDGGGSENISTTNPFYVLGTTSNVSWISTSASPQLLKSSAEYKALTSIVRHSDSINESFAAGGEVAMRIGYKGTTASMTISATGLTTTVTGGSGASLNITFTGLATINDLVAKINAQTGYTAAVGSAMYGQLPPTALDYGTWSICSSQTQTVVGIKKDAYEWFKQLSAQSATVQLGTTAKRTDLGLPEVQASTFLSGGALGASTSAGVQAAIDACEKLKGNFLVALFSRDAADDIADSLTDSGSTYSIDAINAAISTHCTKMSQLKRRRPRQGFASKRTSFTNAKLAAANLAAARMACTFQDVKAVSIDGTIKQYHPWMAGVLAAGMQAAGFYRPMFNKSVNCSGVLQAAGDFSDADQSQVEDALQAGLLVMGARDTGGFSFVSDQTTYGVDGNFVYNSIQAIYVADTLALTIAQRLEKAFVGKSLADVSAAIVLAYLKGIVADLRRLKLVTASDDAPEGYKDATVTISGSAMQVSLSLVEASGVYFIPVKALIQQVSQSASTSK